MAHDYILINDILFGGAVLRAGKKISDDMFDINALIAAGAELIQEDPVSASKADNLNALRAQGRSANIDPGIPIGVGALTSVAASTYLTQAVWHINASTGKDTYDGLLATKSGVSGPLKTWGEMVRRWGRAELNPPNKILEIHIDSDLPDADQITADFNLGPSVQVVVYGKTKTLRTNSGAGLTAATARDALTNAPFTVTDTAVTDWTPYVGKFIEMTSGANVGARALICKDLGSGVAHVSEWMFTFVAPFTDGVGSFPMPAPSAGDKYIVIDMTKVCWGEVSLAGRPGLAAAIPFPPWNTVHFYQFSVQPVGGYFTGEDPAGENGNQQITRCATNEGQWTNIKYYNCIIDLGTFGPYWSFSCNSGVDNCWLCDVEVTPEGMLYMAGGVVTAARGTLGGAFTSMNIGGCVFGGFVPTFLYQGPVVSGFNTLFNGVGRFICGSFAVFYAGDIQPFGGEYWPMRIDLGGEMISFIVDAFSGEPGLPPIWGTNPNSGPINVVSGKVWPMQTLGLGAFVVPTVTISGDFAFDIGFGTAGIFDSADPAVANGAKTYGWNSTTAAWVAPPAFSTWANLLIAVASGGFSTFADSTNCVSTMASPSQGSMICYQCFVI
jgi:hypothetical protein